MKSYFLLAFLFCSGCTTVYYPGGRKAASIGSNVTHFNLKSGNFETTIDGVDNAIIHQTAGDTVTKTGFAAAASGIFPFLSGVIK